MSSTQLQKIICGKAITELFGVYWKTKTRKSTQVTTKRQNCLNKLNTKQSSDHLNVFVLSLCLNNTLKKSINIKSECFKRIY